MKKILTTLLATTLLTTSAIGLTACTADLSEQDANKISSIQAQIDALIESDEQKINSLQEEINQLTEQLNQAQASYQEGIEEISPLGAASYKKLKYIDKNLSDRDCLNGENFTAAQQYIKTNLIAAGYSESEIEFQEISFDKYIKKQGIENALSAAKSYTTDGKSYKKTGWKYTEDASGEYTKATIVSENIVVTKQGKIDKQIIVGMHYDGTGTGDNGSGVALGLTTAQNIKNVQTTYTIKFIFFTAEEYGCYGSTFYAKNMTESEIESTKYMINMDSLVCGDYCYLYGGVQDDKTKTVSKTEAYDNAMDLAESLGLSFKSNPWTYEKLSPEDEAEGVPSYAAPSTGDWSDHAGFKSKGITYLYFEATNWEIPDYTGYGESKLVGMLMNTENDYLDYIETYYPGRPLSHLTKFATLLNALLLQGEW